MSSPFHKRYPPNPLVSIGLADTKAMVLFELGAFANRVNKAASTSVFMTMATARDGRIPEAVGGVKSTFRRPSNLTKEEVDRIPGLYKFAFVRNPYTRVLSAWLSIVKPGKLPPCIPRDSFSEFVDYIAVGGDHLYQNSHWAPMTALLVLPEYDFIGKVETFDDDMRHVLRTIGKPDIDPVRADTVPQTNALRLMEHYYDDRIRAVVYRTYKEDFNRFGYPR